MRLAVKVGETRWSSHALNISAFLLLLLLLLLLLARETEPQLALVEQGRARLRSRPDAATTRLCRCVSARSGS